MHAIADILRAHIGDCLRLRGRLRECFGGSQGVSATTVAGDQSDLGLFPTAKPLPLPAHDREAAQLSCVAPDRR
jgi:hypothetical protein